jgi:mevalonate kinase
MSEHPQSSLDLSNLATSLKVKATPYIPVSVPQAGPKLSYCESRACGKIIFSGEHAVVYGAKALAVPLISKQVHLKIYADPQVTATPKIRFNMAERPVHEELKAMVLEAFDVLSIGRFNVSMEGQSTLLLGAGVGSSASLCVAVLRGLSKLTGVTLRPLEQAHLANQLERRFHGNPSGLDAAVVALEQPILFDRSNTAEPISALHIQKPRGARFPWTFALLDTGVRSHTIDMVKIAAPLFKAQGMALIDEFNAVTSSTQLALESGDISLMAESIQESQRLLTSIGVVNDPIREVVDTAKSCGALASKVTGAGGGGCVLTLLQNDQCDAQIAKLRERLGNGRVHPIFIP